MSRSAGPDATSLPATRLLAAIFEKQLVLLKRYWINTATMLVSMYVFFAIIFYGGQAAGGAAIEDSLDGVVVGFFLFTAATAAYFGAAQDIQREAQWGTLEQLFMSPYGIGRVMAIKSVWQVSWSVVVALALLAVMVLTTDRALSVDVVAVTTLTVLSILSVLGVGFLFAGLSLVYKRIENVTQLLQFVFIGLIAAPAAQAHEYLIALPLALGSDMLYRAMAEDVRLWEFPLVELGALAANGLAYLLVGYLAFHLCVRRARKLGVMGHY